jgi:flagellar protein FliO/FliZ
MRAALLQVASQASERAAELPTGYGAALLQTLLALAAVCILAWVVLRWAAQRGLGLSRGGRHVRVIDQVALDARRTLWLVRVGGRVLLIGAGDQSCPALLATLDEKELEAEGRVDRGIRKAASFVEVLRGRSHNEAPAAVPRAVGAQPEAVQPACNPPAGEGG